MTRSEPRVMQMMQIRRARALVPALAAVCLAAGAAHAQTVPPTVVPAPDTAAAAPVTFAGRVFDQGSRRPVVGARVEFPNLGARGVSDSTGAFHLPEVEAGTHDLLVVAPGYRPVAVVVGLQAGMPAVDVPMAPAPAGTALVARLAGRVVDAKSGRPIRGARVEFISDGAPVLTDSAGIFTLSDAAPGPQMLRVRALGYPTLASVVDVEPGITALATVRLEPDVVMLEGLKVIARRMDRRRLAAAGASRVMRADELAISSAPDMSAFMRQHFGLAEITCGALRPVGGACVIARGRPAELRLMVDERPQIGGLEALAMYDPDDFDRVEVYGGGRVVMLYTVGFMERQARRRIKWLPMPIGV